MSELSEEPPALGRERLRSARRAGEQYRRNLTDRNRNSSAAPAAFSSDEEPPGQPGQPGQPRSRPGRKATRKTDKNRPEEIDVTELTNEGLKDQLLKYGVNAGPIVASTRTLYEKKLQKLLDQGPPQTVVQLPEPAITDGSQNGNTESYQYSDKEEDAVPELDPEPEPVPVVERPLRSRGKTPVTTRTRSGQNKIEKLSAVEQTPKTQERDLLKELFPHETLNTPTGISVTPRRPIKGAASRAFNDAWPDELRPRLTEFRHTSSSTYTENRSTARTNPAPLNSIALSTVPKPAVPPAVPSKTRRLPVWVQLLLLSAVAGFLFFVYQTMETNEMSPFGQSVRSGSLDGTSK